MKIINPVFLAGCLTAILVALARADTDETITECAKSATFLAPIDSSEHRKYAPDREVQVLHLALDISPDFKRRTVSGKATVQFRPTANPVQACQLDEVDLNVHSVTATEKIQAYQVTDDKVIVTFAEPLTSGKEASLTITYDAEPGKGLYFRTP